MNGSEGNYFNLACVVQLLVFRIGRLYRGLTNFSEILSWLENDLEGVQHGFRMGKISSAVHANISSEWRKSQLWSWVHICFRVGKTPSTELRSLDLEGEIPAAKYGPEREKSHNRVSWMLKGEPALPPPSGELPSRHASHWTFKKITWSENVT